jgi:hypothetical protein
MWIKGRRKPPFFSWPQQVIFSKISQMPAGFL